MQRPKKDLKIAYITEMSPKDKHAWSGTAHYAFQSLSSAVTQVTALGPARPGLVRWIMMAANQISLRFFKKRIDYRHSKWYAQSFGRIFSQKLREQEHDIVVVCGGTEYGAYLKTNKPIFYILDRTIAGAMNYHSILTNLWNWSAKQSIETDRLAMLNASLVFFSSHWAAEQAHNFYHLPKQKTCVLPFGANIDEHPNQEEVYQSINSRNLTSECKLLFIGSSWKNKGADIAVDALRHLQKNGVDASLTIVGCQPPENFENPKVHIIPFVDKNAPDGFLQMKNLFLHHHFFILPTRFDCTPIVFCESSAFGVPILSNITGGVQGHVKEGINGHLFEYHSDGQPYANKIVEYINDPIQYKALCFNTRKIFEDSLNWSKWAETFLSEIEHFN